MVIILQEVYLLKALLARLQREGLLSVLINKWNNDKQVRKIHKYSCNLCNQNVMRETSEYFISHFVQMFTSRNSYERERNVL